MLGINVLIDSLSEEALEYCIDYLYNVLNFKFMKREDVRRIDLKEKIDSSECWAPNDSLHRKYIRNQAYTNDFKFSLYYINDFILFIEKYLNSEIMRCKLGSRAHLYQKHVLNLIAKVRQSSDDTTLKKEMINDIFIIFMCFLNRSESIIGKSSTNIIDDIGLISVSYWDYEKLKQFFIVDQCFPCSFLSELKQALLYTKPFKWAYPKDDYNLQYNKDDIKYMLNYMYIYCVLFLSYNLQRIDGFKKEDSENGQDDRN